jgi:hypothetical protein
MKAKSKGKSGKAAANKKELVKEPSTPILFNQNSNSCSNDTNLSTVSSSTTAQQLQLQQQQQNPVYQKQAKVRSLLKELQSYVKKCQQERVNSEPNLVNIMKTHERLKKEEKSNPSNPTSFPSLSVFLTKLRFFAFPIKFLRFIEKNFAPCTRSV